MITKCTRAQTDGACDIIGEAIKFATWTATRSTTEAITRETVADAVIRDATISAATLVSTRSAIWAATAAAR